MAKQKVKVDDIIKAVQGSGGIKRVIAERLGVHRHTIDNYIDRYSSVKQAYVNEVESIGDLAESVIVDALRGKDISTAKWYAKMKLKERGYVERQEVRSFNIDVTQLTNEQLQRIAAGEDVNVVLATSKE